MAESGTKSRNKGSQSQEGGGLKSGKKGGWSRERPEARVGKYEAKHHVNLQDVSVHISRSPNPKPEP